MRFCTSRSLNTSTTSTRFSDSATNSICVTAAWRGRGTVTTPASCVAEDSSCETLAIRSVEVSRLASTWRRISALIASSSGRSCSSVSTKKR